jgi:hypothetical protein
MEIILQPANYDEIIYTGVKNVNTNGMKMAGCNNYLIICAGVEFGILLVFNTWD